MRVYTFTLPKFVSSVVRKCMVVFQKDDQRSKTANQKAKKRKKEQTPG